MAMSNSERQLRWQARTRLKASYFEVQDQRRREVLRRPSPLDDTPEGRAIKRFFLNYPRCHILPSGLCYGDLEGQWTIDVDPYAASEFEKAAALVALGEVSSLKASVWGETEDKVTEWREEDLPVPTVCAEVTALRELGLWGDE